MLLSKEQIFKADDLKTVTVNIPEWGGDVMVKTMTGKERDDWESSMYEIKNGKVEANRDNARAKLCALTLVDENGNRLFTVKEAIQLGEKSAKALERISDAAQKLNGIGKESLDNLEKNSEGEVGDSTPSALPNN